jgi:IS6 family transposase
MKENLFKWKHYQYNIIILCVRWYLKYPLSYRDLAEMMQERGLIVNNTTIYRWVLEYAPIINVNIRKHIRPFLFL